MILYQYPGSAGYSSVSPPCMKVEMALRLLGAEYRVENVNSPRRARQISATGRLPVLELDGERVPDSIAILDRLERLFPDGPLWPVDPAQRLADRLWDHFGTDAMYWHGVYLRWVHPVYAERSFRALFGRMPWPIRLGARLTFLPRQRRRARLHGVGGKPPEAIREEMIRAFEMVSAGLVGGPFLQGRDQPGRGDLAIAALLAQSGFRKSLPETMEQIEAHSGLTTLCRRVFDACEMQLPAWLEPRNTA